MGGDLINTLNVTCLLDTDVNLQFNKHLTRV